MCTPANRRVPALEGGLLGAHVLLGAALEALTLDAPDALVGTVVGVEMGIDVIGLVGVATGELDTDEAGRHWK